MTEVSALEIVLKRDRLIVIAALAMVVVVSWIYILLGAGMGMSAWAMTTDPIPVFNSPHMAIMQPAVWDLGYAVLMFFMWWIMMVAMMLPSAAPTILLFALVQRKQQRQGTPFTPTGAFAVGYILIWGGFSLLATALQWGLERAQLLSPMMTSSNALFGSLVLLAAGIYQLTPLKHACLKHCRGPVEFIAGHFRPGKTGALYMGIQHGGFCLACCWFLMALLFVGGVMNLYWIAGLAIFVLLEKTIPNGHRFGWITGLGLIAWGGWIALDML